MRANRSLVLGALLLSAALYGGCNCGGQPSGEDAGVDAGVVEDAGTDAGEPPDAGPTDAGEDQDAGPPPELKIDQVLPPRGPTTGGVRVTLRGSGFLRGVADRATAATKNTQVKFGSNPAQDFQVIDDGTLDVRVPPGKAGLANITVENANGIFVCEACFTYFEELFIKTATPKEGPLRGGTEVTVTGGGLTPDVQVLFGGLSAPQITVVDSKELTVVAPRATAPGPVDITVFSKNGVGVLRNVFRYYPDLRVSSVTPLSGPLAGGTQVTLSGTGFFGTMSVKFGGVEAASFTVVDDDQLTAVTPPGMAAGKVPITITTTRDQWTVRDGFYYEGGAGFVLGGVAPHVGPAAGGNTVTLFGEGFDPGNVSVTIGGQPASIVSASANEVQVIVPPRNGARLADVTLTDGTNTQTLADGYTYRIELTAIAPARGPITGGTAATVTGTGIPADAQVNVGALAAEVQCAPSETSIALLTPKGQGGAPTDVWVREAADPENEAVLKDAFTYDEVLTIGRVQPDRGAIAGGTLVSVLGTGFGEDTIVRFGKYVAKDIKVVDAHTLTCRTPKADDIGAVDVQVERLGASDPLPGGFAYFDPRSISGGLSGGPLSGTLNVTVLDNTSQATYGLPVELATVMLGTDPFTPYQGVTDQRGQITFSDPALVKAQTVTVFKEGYQTATVTNVNAENLTVFIARTGGDGSPAPPPPGPPPSIISGHVTGFKAPRPLGPNEKLEARVFLAMPSPYYMAPFANPPNRTGQKWQVVKDGGEYLLATNSGLHAVYAILGIANNQAKSFEPYLMGIKRGITVTPDQPATNQDIILDMHLDMTVPVTIQDPISPGGVPAMNYLYAWLDLGAEGFIPNPNNWASGEGSISSIGTTGTQVAFPNFPQLDGSNFVFMNVAQDTVMGTQSIFFRRQPGDISSAGGGVTIGPMLPIPTITEPPPDQPVFNGKVSWVTDPGPTPDITQVSIFKLTLLGPVTLWSIVLPGTETSVTLPPAAVQKLRNDEPNTPLFAQVVSSRSPKFSYNQWTYETLSQLTWSSYTFALSTAFTP